MNLKPYAEILNMAKEDIDKTLIPSRIKRARTQAELEIAKLEESIATKTAKIQELCYEEEINFDSIIETQDELALLERKLEQFNNIVNEMFPE